MLVRAFGMALYLNLDFPREKPSRQGVAPVRRTLSHAGEVMGVLVLIIGGMIAIGLASLT